MSYQVETDSFINNLDRVAIRYQVADWLSKIAETLDKAESAEQTSGKLGLERDIFDIKVTGENYC